MIGLVEGASFLGEATDGRRFLVDADHRQDVEPLSLHLRDQPCLEERRFSGARRRVKQDNALGDQQVEQIAQFMVSPVKLLASLEGTGTDIWIGSCAIFRHKQSL